jgi:hypothetical protein
LTVRREKTANAAAAISFTAGDRGRAVDVMAVKAVT